MGFLLWRIEWCDRNLCHVIGSDHAQLNARIRGWSALEYKTVLYANNILWSCCRRHFVGQRNHPSTRDKPNVRLSAEAEDLSRLTEGVPNVWPNFGQMLG